jgi:hypothetical protein
MTQHSLLNGAIFINLSSPTPRYFAPAKINHIGLNDLSCFERFATWIWQRILVVTPCSPFTFSRSISSFIIDRQGGETNFDRIRSSNFQKKLSLSLCIYVPLLWHSLRNHNLDVISPASGSDVKTITFSRLISSRIS